MKSKSPKKNRMRHAAAAALTALLLGGCSQTPEMVLGKEKMARLMADMELAEALGMDRRLGEFYTDSSRLELRRAVLAKHKINEAVLDSSLRWYGRNLPEFLDVIDRADTILGDSMRALDEMRQLAATSAAGDSVNLWALAPSAVFARTEASDFVTFTVAVDSTWRRGDVLTLEFALDNATTPLNATLGVDYANRAGLTETIGDRFYPGDRRRFELTMQLDSNVSAKRVFGYMFLPAAEGERAFVDSIRLVRTRLVPDNYNHLRYRVRGIRRNDF